MVCYACLKLFHGIFLVVLGVEDYPPPDLEDVIAIFEYNEDGGGGGGGGDCVCV